MLSNNATFNQCYGNGQPRNWQRRRSAFNHDWMKNKYLQALDDWISLLDDKQEDEALECSFIAEKLPKWEENRKNALWLYDNFESEMSPRVLLGEPPLISFDNHEKQWLGDVVHFLWFDRYRIKDLLETLSSSIADANASYERLVEILRTVVDTRNAPSMRPLRPLFAEFRTSCGAVATAIEKFPSEVLVP